MVEYGIAVMALVALVSFVLTAMVSNRTTKGASVSSWWVAPQILLFVWMQYYYWGVFLPATNVPPEARVSYVMTYGLATVFTYVFLWGTMMVSTKFLISSDDQLVINDQHCLFEFWDSVIRGYSKETSLCRLAWGFSLMFPMIAIVYVLIRMLAVFSCVLISARNPLTTFRKDLDGALAYSLDVRYSKGGIPQMPCVYMVIALLAYMLWTDAKAVALAIVILALLGIIVYALFRLRNDRLNPSSKPSATATWLASPFTLLWSVGKTLSKRYCPRVSNSKDNVDIY